MKLKDILKTLPKDNLFQDVCVFPAGCDKHGEDTIMDVFYDSRKVIPNSIFVAISGYETDGNKFIQDAIEMGAVAIVVSKEFQEKEDFSTIVSNIVKKSLDSNPELSTRKVKTVSIVVVKDCRKALSQISAMLSNYPWEKLDMIGVTGTNGKTSVTYILDALWRLSGMKSAVIGTIEYRWPGERITSTNTTPESKDLTEMISKIVKSGVSKLAMEVSSHALYLSRIESFTFKCAIFTNLTQDHLDFHNDMEDYFMSKRRLFEPDILKGPAIINVDDPYGMRLAEYVSQNKRNLSTLSHTVNPRDKEFLHTSRNYLLSNLKSDMNGTSFSLNIPAMDNIQSYSQVNFVTKLKGKFNAQNCALAVIAAFESGLDINSIKKALSNEKMKVPGRFEVVPGGEKKEFLVVVDYAHTPDALKSILESAKEMKLNRLITIFGCGGDRDRKKRPLMGRVVEQYSDFFIITSDNPRTEDPLQIIEEIKKGINTEKPNFTIIQDRKEAIFKAINICQKGDILVIAGKGHEDYQILKEGKIHFDDREIAAQALDKL